MTKRAPPSPSLLEAEQLFQQMDEENLAEFAESGSVQECATVKRDDGDLLDMPTPVVTGTDHDRRVFSFFLREIRARKYALTGEAWSRPDDGPNIAPSKSDRRTEYVFLTVCGMDHEPLFGRREIHRETSGPRLGDMERFDGLEGPLTTLFRIARDQFGNY